MNYSDLKALKTRPELFSAVIAMSDEELKAALGEAPEKERRTAHDSWIVAVLAGRIIEKMGVRS